MTKHNSTLSPEQLNQLLRYEPETGRFFWRKAPKGWRRSTNEAGCSGINGYIYIMVNQINYRAHRLAYTMYYGRWPEEHIDHLNGITNDNRISNLRAVSNSRNMRNAKMKSHNKSGFNGVNWHKRSGKWRAFITHKGKVTHLGCFTDIEDAVKARKEAEKGLGFTQRHGLDDA